MVSSPNALRWNGQPGHYEVYYLTLTDARTGVGVWLRYTMVAPLTRSGQPPSCALWLLAMDPRPGHPPTFGRKATYPVELLDAPADAFELRIGDASLDQRGAAGAFEDVGWELRWTPATRGYAPVDPRLRRLGLASTAFVVPEPDLSIDGEIILGGERIELSGARGAQAHVWGSKHASSWAWVHCNDLRTLDGEHVAGAFLDGVSATVSRFGRELGPNTPVVGSFDGADFRSTSPLRIVSNASTYGLSGWRFEAVHRGRKLIGEVDAVRDQLAGVTYHDPDGESAYCYNSETASLRLHLYQRARQVGGWAHAITLVAPGRAHFEYAQRTPVPGIELLTR